MKPKRRMETLLTVLTLGVIAIAALVSYALITDRAEAIEQARLADQGRTIVRLLADDLAALGKINRDYAQWDATLTFHQEGSEAYEIETFNAEVFNNLNISHMLFFEESGRIRNGFSVSEAGDNVVPVSDASAAAFDTRYGGVIRAKQQSGLGVEGLVVIGGQPKMMTMHRISDSAGTVFDGAMAMLRPLDDDVRLKLESIIRAELKWLGADGGDAFAAVDSASVTGAIGDFVTDHPEASARLVLTDILREPVIGIQLTEASQMWALSRQILVMILILTCISVVAIVMLQSWLNHIYVLKPIRAMGQRLMEVSDESHLEALAALPDTLLMQEDLSIFGRIHGMLRRISEDSARLHRERLSIRLALESSAAGTWEYDRVKRQVQGDGLTASILNLGPGPIALDWETLMLQVHSEDREALRDVFLRIYPQDRSGFQMECRVGEDPEFCRWILLKGNALAWDQDGYGTHFSGIILDNTTKKRMESELLFLSYHDKLTGLFNRRYFEEQLMNYDNPQSLPVTIFVADINGLKLANDAFGHERGDKLLKQAAQCLRHVAGDGAVISRWGGDEFAVLLPQCDAEAAKMLLARIKNHCKEHETHRLGLHLAVGFAVKSGGVLTLQHVVRSAEEAMYRDKLMESRNAHADFMENFRRQLDEKGIETEEHCQRVAAFGEALGRRLGLDEQMLKEINQMGTVHDIGKIGMPESIFVKSDALTDLEWSLVQSHPEIGFRIVALMQDYAHLAQAVLAHHERYDGTGYPRGLTGREIPFVSRIIAISDAVDVMLTGTPYQPPKTVDAVVAELERESGHQFDPELVPLMIELLQGKSPPTALGKEV